MRRPGVDVLLAVVLPGVCALALSVVHPDRSRPAAEQPVETPLSSASVVCPAALPGTGDSMGVSTLGVEPGTDVRGEAQVGLADPTAPLHLRSGRVSAAAPAPGATVVTVTGDLAPGLVAGRSRSAPLAAVDCAPPAPDQWFTAAGAGPTHDSVLELVNPNAGVAIADVTVRGPSGLLDVPALRGVSVRGRSSLRLDLGQVLPRRGELSLDVHTSRGRLAAHVVDSYDELGAGAQAEDWLPAQPAPAEQNVLLGLDRGTGERTLVLANPGADEVRATLEVVTPSSVYAPSGVDPVRIAPDSTEAVSLDDVLARAAKDGATGLLVTSTGPVTATLRQVLDDDLSLLAPSPAVGSTTAAVLPAGAKRLLLGAPDGVGVATLTAYAANGKQLDQQRVELAPEAGADVPLPDRAALATLTVERTSVRAGLLVTGRGTAVVPLRELVLTGLVPDVRPGVP